MRVDDDDDGKGKRKESTVVSSPLGYVFSSISNWLTGGRNSRKANRSGSPSQDDQAWMETFQEALRQTNSSPKQIRLISRRGIPDHLRGAAWRGILQIDRVPPYLQDYKAALRGTFGTEAPTMHFEAPCFGATATTACIDAIFHETSKPLGRVEYKRLLAVIGHAHPNLEYTPIIPVLVAILLRYLGDPGQVLGAMAALVSGHAIPASKRQEWAYFPLHRRDYLIFERVFWDLMAQHTHPNLAKHLSRMQQRWPGYTPEWHRLLSELMLGIYPIKTVLRIVDVYLVEGYKVLLRVALAHLSLRAERILAAGTPDLLDQALFGPDALDNDGRLFRVAYEEIHLSRAIIYRLRSRNRKLSLGDFDGEDRLQIFQRPLPQLLQPSATVGEPEWAQIWSWVPARYRLLNLEMVFTTRQDGRNLGTLYERCAGSEPLLLIVEGEESSAIIGAYISRSIESRPASGLFFGTGETFLFRLKPGPAAHYTWDPVDPPGSSFVCATPAFLAIGAGTRGFGLCLDRDLLRVTSAACYTFGSRHSLLDSDSSKKSDEILSDGIYSIEIFRFV